MQKVAVTKNFLPGATTKYLVVPYGENPQTHGVGTDNLELFNMTMETPFSIPGGHQYVKFGCCMVMVGEAVMPVAQKVKKLPMKIQYDKDKQQFVDEDGDTVEKAAQVTFTKDHISIVK